MELDDLKKDWESVTGQSSQQNILSHKNIDQMTQQKYKAKVNKIKYPEWIGGAGCLLLAGYLVFNFYKLDTIFYQATGVLGFSLLIIMPVLSILSLVQFTVANNLNKSYAEAIRQFAHQKKRFIKYQKINALLSYLLLVTTIILAPKLFQGKRDIAGNEWFWLASFSFGYIFLLFVTKWIKKVYGNALKQAEELLIEVNS